MDITCPYCWESIAIEDIPFSEDPVELVLDCEVCCRPIAVTASWNEGATVPWLGVRAES